MRPGRAGLAAGAVIPSARVRRIAVQIFHVRLGLHAPPVMNNRSIFMAKYGIFGSGRS